MKNIWNKYTDLFGYTIFHPQFIMNKFTWEGISKAQKLSKAKSIVDIGCGRMKYKDYLLKKANSYTAIDSPDTSKMYETSNKPDIFADAQNLPFKNNSFETALLLQVIEYLPTPQKAINEALRVLKKNGFLVITSPFMYPIHDGRYDRNRFTRSQFEFFFENKNVSLKIVPQGGFFDFWIQTFLVFWFKSGMKFPIILLPAPIVVPSLNIINILLRPIGKAFSANSDFPLNYLVIAKKK